MKTKSEKETKLQIIKDALFEYLSEKHTQVTKENWEACFFKKGQRRGFLRDALPYGHGAQPLFLALQMEANVYKHSIGKAIFLPEKEKNLYLALSRDVEKVGKFVRQLDSDRAALESLKAW